MTDLLRMGYINAPPQPVTAMLLDGTEWPVYDIEVGTGLMRIDVMGKLDIREIVDAIFFRDGDGNEHSPDSFYSDYVDGV